MNLSEFKAWFEGFTENLDGPPNKKQWEKIAAKIGEIKDAPATSHTVFVDRYVRDQRYWPYWPYHTTQPWWGTPYAHNGFGSGATQMTSDSSLQKPSYQSAMQQVAQSWQSSDGFKALGRIDAKLS